MNTTTVYKEVQQMSKVEFAEFCLALYNKALVDSANGVDDRLFVRARLSDMDYEYFKKVIVHV